MTLGFSQITNDAGATVRQLDKYGKYFDRYFITVADKNKQEFYKLKKLKDPKLVLGFYKWDDNFGKARIENHKLIDTDYWFWMDTDDDIDQPENLRPNMEFMDKNALDVMYFNYNYLQNEHGEGINDHRRERIIKTGSVEWSDVPVHETLIGQFARQAYIDNVVVVHNKTPDQVNQSHSRNKRLLLKHFEETKDPRTAYYLGEVFLAGGDAKGAMPYYKFLIDNGGWDEEKFDAWLKLSDCFYRVQDYKQAIICCDEALKIDVDKPEAFFQKVLIYVAAADYAKAVEWGKWALTKKVPATIRLVDPTLVEYRGPFMVALSLMFSGEIKSGFSLFQQVKQKAPHFIADYEKQSNTNWTRWFEESYYDEKALDYAKYLTHYLRDYGGRPERLFESLPAKLFGDVRLNAERVLVYPPQKWPTKSVAIFCGQGLEHWGPDTLAQGMGGSEEAIVYLSRELAKLGWAVTVFNDREEEYDEAFSQINGEWRWDRFVNTVSNDKAKHQVSYKPWTTLNPNDEFDVFIGSRRPENCRGVKARVKLADLHDTVQPEIVYACADDVDKFLVKTKYHRELYPKLPDDKFIVVGNGILKEHFE